MAARRQAWWAGALLALLLVVVATPSGAFAWTVPAAVSPAAQDASLSNMAMDAAGKATIAWSALNGPTDARVRRADGSLAPIAVVDNGEEFPDVATDGHGNSYFVWSGFDGSTNRIYFRRLSSSGVLGPTLTLSAGTVDAIEPAIAVDSVGDAVVAWDIRSTSDPKYQVQIRAVAARGKKSTTRTTGKYGAQPRVAMDPGGDATVFWWKWRGFAAIQRGSDGAFGPRIKVSTAGVGTHEVQMDSNGDATFLYQVAPGLQQDDAVLYARQLPQGGGLGPQLTVGKVGRGRGTFALDGAGDGFIVWAPRTTQPQVLRGRALAANGTLGSVQPLSTKPVFTSDVAVNATGDAVVAWEQDEAGSQTSVDAVRWAADGTLGPVQKLSGSTANNGSPVVGLADSGHAVATWTRVSDHGHVMFSADP
jgi:hypothetical protein